MTGTTPPAVPDEIGPVAELRRIAVQDIGGNAPWLADELLRFADRLAAEMRGECQWDGAAEPLAMPTDEFAALRTVAERFGIGVIQPASAEDWTPEQLAELKASFDAAMANPAPFRVLPFDHWKDRAEAAEAALEHAKAALAGDHEGIRLWMLDCGELVAKHRARAEAAEAKLAAITDACRSIPSPIAERILGIIGSNEEARDG